MPEETAVEKQLTSLVAALTEHVKDDARQFEAMRGTFQDGMASLRNGLDTLSKSIEAALSGDDERAGIRERIRTLEAKEQNRKWMTGILFVAVVSIGLKELLDWIHVVNLK